MTISQADYIAMVARLQPRGPAISTAAASRERNLHDAILAECRRRGWIAIHGRMDKPSTFTIGSPDFVIMADNHRTIYVEAKARQGKLSAEQHALHVWALKLGHTVHVVHNLDEFLALLRIPPDLV